MFSCFQSLRNQCHRLLHNRSVFSNDCNFGLQKLLECGHKEMSVAILRHVGALHLVSNLCATNVIACSFQILNGIYIEINTINVILMALVITNFLNVSVTRVKKKSFSIFTKT